MQIYQLFEDRFGSFNNFASKGGAEKMDYLESLLKMEVEFTGKSMVGPAAASKLLGLVLANTLSGSSRDMKNVVMGRFVFEDLLENGVINWLAGTENDGPRIHALRRDR